MSKADMEFLERRAREERRRAETAPDPKSYRVHLERARQYERRILSGADDGLARGTPGQG